MMTDNVTRLPPDVLQMRAPSLLAGSLRDVVGVAGYVDGARGERWVVVAIINHAHAQAARGALEAVVEWVGKQP